jgi:hypothetical protein
MISDSVGVLAVGGGVELSHVRSWRAARKLVGDVGPSLRRPGLGELSPQLAVRSPRRSGSWKSGGRGGYKTGTNIAAGSGSNKIFRLLVCGGSTFVPVCIYHCAVFANIISLVGCFLRLTGKFAYILITEVVG